jgi:hypothetical protein
MANAARQRSAKPRTAAAPCRAALPPLAGSATLRCLCCVQMADAHCTNINESIPILATLAIFNFSHANYGTRFNPHYIDARCVIGALSAVRCGAVRCGVAGRRGGRLTFRGCPAEPACAAPAARRSVYIDDTGYITGMATGLVWRNKNVTLVCTGEDPMGAPTPQVQCEEQDLTPWKAALKKARGARTPWGRCAGLRVLCAAACRLVEPGRRGPARSSLRLCVCLCAPPALPACPGLGADSIAGCPQMVPWGQDLAKAVVVAVCSALSAWIYLSAGNKTPSRQPSIKGEPAAPAVAGGCLGHALPTPGQPRLATALDTSSVSAGLTCPAAAPPAGRRAPAQAHRRGGLQHCRGPRL